MILATPTFSIQIQSYQNVYIFTWKELRYLKEIDDKIEIAIEH